MEMDLQNASMTTCKILQDVLCNLVISPVIFLQSGCPPLYPLLLSLSSSSSSVSVVVIINVTAAIVALPVAVAAAAAAAAAAVAARQ